MMACPLFFPTHFSQPIILMQVYLVFISPNNLIPELFSEAFFRMFLAKAPLASLFVNVISGLHVAVNSVFYIHKRVS